MKHALTAFSLLLVLASCTDSDKNLRAEQEQRRDVAVRTVRTDVDDVRHTVQNTHSELAILNERQADLSASLASLKSQMDELVRSNRSTADDRAVATQKRLTQLETENQKLQASLADLGSKLAQVDKDSEARNKQVNASLDNLKKSIGELIASFKPAARVADKSASTDTYKVQNGDSLEKIAKRFGMSTTELKSLNNITSDKIVVGQTLKVAASI